MRRSLLAPVVVPALCLLVLTGCGGDDGGTVSASAAASVEASADTGAGPGDKAAAEAEVRTAWEGFFDGAAPAADRAAFIERAADLAPALALAGKDPNAAMTSAKVQSVQFTSATEASVTYDLSSAGTVVLPGAQGKAVLEDGAWKVSAMTFCQLTALSAPGVTVPGCS